MINKEKMKEAIRQQASLRPVEITDEQVENLMSEAEDVFGSHQMAKAMGNQMGEQQMIMGSFIAGALFGLDRCDPKKETLVMEKSKDDPELKVNRYKEFSERQQRLITRTSDVIVKMKALKQTKKRDRALEGTSSALASYIKDQLSDEALEVAEAVIDFVSSNLDSISGP